MKVKEKLRQSYQSQVPHTVFGGIKTVRSDDTPITVSMSLNTLSNAASTVNIEHERYILTFASFRHLAPPTLSPHHRIGPS